MNECGVNTCQVIMCVYKSLQSCLTLCDPVECSPPGSLSMGFSRQEYWSGLPFPSPGDFPGPGIEPGSPALQADALSFEPPGKPPNNREGTQPHPSTENWIKDLLSMVLPIRTRPSFPLSQSLPSENFHKPLILLHQRADRLKTTITED